MEKYLTKEDLKGLEAIIREGELTEDSVIRFAEAVREKDMLLGISGDYARTNFANQINHYFGRSLIESHGISYWLDIAEIILLKEEAKKITIRRKFEYIYDYLFSFFLPGAWAKKIRKKEQQDEVNFEGLKNLKYSDLLTQLEKVDLRPPKAKFFSEMDIGPLYSRERRRYYIVLDLQ